MAVIIISCRRSEPISAPQKLNWLYTGIPGNYTTILSNFQSNQYWLFHYNLKSTNVIDDQNSHQLFMITIVWIPFNLSLFLLACYR